MNCDFLYPDNEILDKMKKRSIILDTDGIEFLPGKFQELGHHTFYENSESDKELGNVVLLSWISSDDKYPSFIIHNEADEDSDDQYYILDGLDWALSIFLYIIRTTNYKLNNSENELHTDKK